MVWRVVCLRFAGRPDPRSTSRWTWRRPSGSGCARTPQRSAASMRSTSRRAWARPSRTPAQTHATPPFLRIRASWVTPCASSSRTPPFSMHRTSPVVPCSSGSGRQVHETPFFTGRRGWCALCLWPFSMRRASWVVRCSSGSGRRGWCSVPQVHGPHRSRGRHGWCGVPEVQGVVGGVLCLRFTDPIMVLDARGVMGGAVFLRFRASSGSRSDVRRPDQVPWLAGSAF